MSKNTKATNKLIENLKRQLQIKRDSYTQMSYELAIQTVAEQIFPMENRDLFDYSNLFPVHVFNR